jgi:Dyp-type peroxidase family
MTALPNLNSEDGLAEDHEILTDLQGNILKGHGREHTCLLFFEFNKSPDEAKKLIFKISQLVTSAAQQFNQIRNLKQKGSGDEWFVNFFLSRKGYTALQIPFERRFLSMQDRVNRLGDPTINTWDSLYQGNIHAMFLLAHKNTADLPKNEQDVSAWFRSRKIDLPKHATLLGIELGDVIKKNERPVEHFGYVDGISQPLFFQMEIIEDNKKNKHWPSRAPLNLVLARDPNVKEPAFGSFLVFRKLKQHVDRFNEAIQKLAAILPDKNEERAAALVMGRFRDGTPIQEHSENGKDPLLNNFNYDGDSNSGGRNDPSKCPFHAHIRRSNPRGSHQEGYTKERQHRIIRRSIPFGNPQSRGEKGLLFMCFQSDIESQFEHIQRVWCNDDPDQFYEPHGLDPLIGQGPSRIPQKWPLEWGQPNQKEFEFRDFVELKGGEYFFAPSMKFLKTLGGND